MMRSANGAREIGQDGPRAEEPPERDAAERYGGWPPDVDWALLCAPMILAAAYVALCEIGAIP